MARMAAEKKSQWKNSLAEITSGLVICGLDATSTKLATRLEGLPGLVDWRLHGQVSRLLAKKQFGPGESCLVPGDPRLERPSFLFVHCDTSSDARNFANSVKKLGVAEVHLAETTFPEDFLSKLKQNFKKEGVRCTKVEPETNEPS